MKRVEHIETRPAANIEKDYKEINIIVFEGEAVTGLAMDHMSKTLCQGYC
jgi:hypothetical protein